jgi:hypothetical protein
VRLVAAVRALLHMAKDGLEQPRPTCPAAPTRMAT